jgi:hypothetical protein
MFFHAEPPMLQITEMPSVPERRFNLVLHKTGGRTGAGLARLA